MHDVFFLSHERIVSVPAGTSLLEAAHLAGIVLESPCNREGTCGKCGVVVHGEDRLNLRYEESGHRLTGEKEADGWVLGCQAYVYGAVRVSETVRSERGLAIVVDGKRRQVPLDPLFRKEFDSIGNVTRLLLGDRLVDIQTGNTEANQYGVVVDIGTTTLVVVLLDLKNGIELGTISSLNPQASHAQDVLSRIKLGSSHEGLRLLRDELMRELNRMVARLAISAGISRSDIYEAIFSGNTTMLTIAARTSPASLGRYPYQVSVPTGCSFSSGELGFEIAEKGSVWFPPVASAYVGGDIISGIMAADLLSLKGRTLFVDIGTNGEMVLAEDGKLTATSTAAGPAFEGMNISCGMRATDGAIEKVRLHNGIVEVQTISAALPTGLCGSGLLDVVAELSREGVADRNGRLAKPGSKAFERWQHSLEMDNGRIRFRLSPKVTLSQQDIRQVQLAKAAVRAGIDMLLLKCSILPEDVDCVFIAGSFGVHLQVSSLIILALLPESFAERVEFLGNTSRSGAELFLLNQETRLEAASMVKQMRVLELSGEPEFEKLFLQALAFQHSEERKVESEKHGI